MQIYQFFVPRIDVEQSLMWAHPYTAVRLFPALVFFYIEEPAAVIGDKLDKDVDLF
jgi:hypothetical protein